MAAGYDWLAFRSSVGKSGFRSFNAGLRAKP